MKLMNIVGYFRTSTQKKVMKANRQARRDRRVARKWHFEDKRAAGKKAKRMNRHNRAILNRP